MSNKKITVKYSVISSTMECYLVVRMNDTYMEKIYVSQKHIFERKKIVTRRNIQDYIILIKSKEI